MRISIKLTLAALVAIIGIGATSLTPSYAATCSTPAACAQIGVDKTNPDPTGTPTIEEVVQTIVNVLLFIIGAVSVVMIILGGIRYTISQGDSTAVANAKNTILYAVIGLVVAILAFAIVNFVIAQFVASP